MRQDTVSGVPATATQGTEAGNPQWRWAEASIWTERMVSALVNGVKGGKWFSLVDKVIRPTTLDVAWHKVARNKGAGGWMARASNGLRPNRSDICKNFTTV